MTEEIDFKPDNCTLQLCVSLIRHGERAPVVFFKDDPNKDDWPNGHGNLTNLGKQQAFKLGEQLKETYKGFLSEHYQSDEIYVRSTDVDRCLDTAQACMAGLYPANCENIWNESSSWRPVPVHTSSRLSEPCMVNFEGFVSPPFEKISPCFAEFLKDNKSLIDDVIKATGYPRNLFLVGALLQGLKDEMKVGRPTPHSLGRSFDELETFCIKLYHFFVSIFPAVLVPTAHTLDALLGIIEKKVSGQKPQLKAYWFFTHDFMMSCFLECLCDDFERPGFVGTLFFELHKHPKTGDLFVMIVYKTGLKCEQRDVKLRGCPVMCPVKDFANVLRNFISFYKL